MKKLLICTDGSNYSQEACRYGAALAQEADAEIKVLYVTDIRQFEVPAIADFSGSLGIQPYDGMISQMQEMELHKARFIEEHAMKIFEEAGLTQLMPGGLEPTMMARDVPSRKWQAASKGDLDTKKEHLLVFKKTSM